MFGIGAALLGGTLLGGVLGGDSGGQAPSASNQPAISPEQQRIMEFLGPLLQSRGIDAPGFGGQLTAPLSGMQQTSLAALEQAALPGATQATQGGFKTLDAGNTALQGILAQGPDFSAKTFKTSVVDPMMANFSDRIIPQLESAYGANAGGASSSDFANTLRHAAGDLDTTLAGAGSAFAMANESNILKAGALAPGMSQAGMSPLMSILQAGAIPQENAQQSLSAQYGEFNRQQQQSQQFVQQLLSFMGTPTQNTVVNPGQPSFLQSLAPGLGQAAGSFGLGQMMTLLGT